MRRCRDCDAQIEFVRLNSGKFAPVESAEPEEYQVWTEVPEVRGAARVREICLVVHGEIVTMYTRTAEGKLVPGPLKVSGCEVHRCA